MKSLLMTTMIATLVGAGTAFAAPAIVTTPLHLRTGPGSNYRVETTMPEGVTVNVRGCTRGYGWCRVNWNGYDGWASSNYLAQRQGRRRRSYSHYGAQIGIPLIAGAIIGNALDNDRHDHRHDNDHRNRRSDRGGHDNHHGRNTHRRGNHDSRGHDNDHGRNNNHRRSDNHDRNNHHDAHDRGHVRKFQHPDERNLRPKPGHNDDHRRRRGDRDHHGDN